MAELEIKNLSKNYGSIQALQNMSCTLQNGVYGLLGANGAGKSTLMNIITGNIKADVGKVYYDGHDITEKKEREHFRRILGYMPQYPVIYRGFTVEEFLFYIAALRGMERGFAKKRVAWILDLLELADAKDAKMTALSGGMKQRLMLAQAVIGNPKVLILDEPTAGLDPKQRIAVRNLISEISFDKIVMIATHVVTDVEFISKEIILLKEGVMIEKAQREELVEQMAGRVYEIRTDISQLKRIQETYLVGNIVKEHRNIYVRILSDTYPKEEEVKQVRASLEDVYLYYFQE